MEDTCSLQLGNVILLKKMSIFFPPDKKEHGMMIKRMCIWFHDKIKWIKIKTLVDLHVVCYYLWLHEGRYNLGW